jgi:hypothetical protein
VTEIGPGPYKIKIYAESSVLRDGNGPCPRAFYQTHTWPVCQNSMPNLPEPDKMGLKFNTQPTREHFLRTHACLTCPDHSRGPTWPTHTRTCLSNLAQKNRSQILFTEKIAYNKRSLTQYSLN